MLAFLPEWCMARLLECDPFDLGDSVEEGRHHEILRDIFPSVNDERRDSHKVQAFDDRPVIQDPAERSA